MRVLTLVELEIISVEINVVSEFANYNMHAIGAYFRMFENLSVYSINNKLLHLTHMFEKHIADL